MEEGLGGWGDPAGAAGSGGGLMPAAVPAGNAGELAALESLARGAAAFLESSRADNTLRAYRADWRDFDGWCRRHGRASLPAAPETVALYLTELAATRKPSTIQRRIAGITQAHLAAGHEGDGEGGQVPTRSALVKGVWKGIRRSRGVASAGKAPALTADLRQMVDALPEGTLLATRDRALLLLGFAGAMRRGELVGLDVGDALFTREGLVVMIRRSKTDQEGQGRKVGVPYGSRSQTCPVRALRDWIDAIEAVEAVAGAAQAAAGRASTGGDPAAPMYKEGRPPSGPAPGPLFRRVDRHGNLLPGRLGDRAVALVVKRALAAAGRGEAEVAAYAGHSLRAGLATSAAMAGVPERAIQDQTGHKSLPVLRRYIRDGSLFRENAAAQVGL